MIRKQCSNGETNSLSVAAGEYRLHANAFIFGQTVVRLQPLVATRLNKSGLRALRHIEKSFHSAEEVAEELVQDESRVRGLFSKLYNRDLLEWRPSKDDSFNPAVSVVITVKDDKEGLRKCLDAIAKQEYHDYEVIVVVDGANKRVGRIAEGHTLKEQGLLRVKYVGADESPLGIGASRNVGVELAGYDYIAFTDADCVPRRDWLVSLIPVLQENSVVGGRVCALGQSDRSEYEKYHSSLNMGENPSPVEPTGDDTPYLPTANLLGEKDVFVNIQFPEQDIGEDVEFSWKAWEQGKRIVYEPEGVVDHRYPNNNWSFLRKRMDYGASEALLSKKYSFRSRIPLRSSLIIGSIVLTLALLMGTFSITLRTFPGTTPFTVTRWHLYVIGSIFMITPPLLRTVDRMLDLLGIVSPSEVVKSALRSGISTTISISREISRYYSFLIIITGILLLLSNFILRPGHAVLYRMGGLLVSASIVALVLPLLTRYVVMNPELSLSSYAKWYLLDQIGYQIGVYQGILEYRTVNHLLFHHRFSLELW